MSLIRWLNKTSRERVDARFPALNTNQNRLDYMPAEKHDAFLETHQGKSRKSIGKREHGFTGHGWMHPLYQCWHGIKRRCLNPKRSDYQHYGGRGIKVCERWLDFENFKDDMYATWNPGLTIERKDNNGDYCPENCYWATRAIQARNKRNSVFVTLNGETRCFGEWIRVLGLKRYTVNARIRRGWSRERSLTEPTGKWHRK